MPRISDTKAINNEKLDRRVKLTASEKSRVKELSSEFSQRYLAQMFGVSRRTIQFIIDPNKLIENKKRRAERGGSKIYYDRDSHNESMKEHRNYKSELYKKGLI